MKLNVKPRIGKHVDENVIRTFNTHWIALAFPFVTTIIVFIGGFMFLTVTAFETDIRIQIFALCSSISVYLFSKSTNLWLNEIYQVTQTKIFHARVSFFHKIKKREIMLGLVKTIEESRPSFLAYLLGYAHLKIGTDYYEKSAIFSIRYLADSHELLRAINKAQ